MSPDEAYMEKQAKAEEEKLQKKIQALSDSDRKEIYEKGTHNFTLHCGESLFSFAKSSAHKVLIKVRGGFLYYQPLHSVNFRHKYESVNNINIVISQARVGKKLALNI